MKSAILASLVAGASATVYFKESFDSCKFFFGYKDQNIRRHVFKKTWRNLYRSPSTNPLIPFFFPALQ